MAFENVKVPVGDEALGGFYFAAPRLRKDQLEYFTQHPDPRVAELARAVLKRVHCDEDPHPISWMDGQVKPW